MKRLAIVLLLPFAARAQLVLATGGCTTGSPISSGSVYNFGQVAAGAAKDVSFFACNPGNSSVNVTTIAIAGGGFSITGAPATYVDPPNNALPLQFTVHFSGSTPASYSATLQVNTINVFLLATVVPAPAPVVPAPAPVVPAPAPVVPACTGSVPPLPAPVLTFDSNVFASGQQHTVTMNLPTSYPCAASGYLNLAFTPGTTVVTDDPAVIFMAGSVRTLPFSVTPNTTQISIAGQGSAVFQTGTTAGTITFTVTANGLQITGNPSTTINIPPAVMVIESAIASNQTLGQLNVEITGFDNTYTTGVMSFTFFDTSGKVISPGAVSADFTSQFQTYFTTSTGGSPSGSSFVMNVSFPITGPVTQAGDVQALVGSVQATLTNAAGQAQTGSLTFQ